MVGLDRMMEYLPSQSTSLGSGHRSLSTAFSNMQATRMSSHRQSLERLRHTMAAMSFCPVIHLAYGCRCITCRVQPEMRPVIFSPTELDHLKLHSRFNDPHHFPRILMVAGYFATDRRLRCRYYATIIIYLLLGESSGKFLKPGCFRGTQCLKT
jgi:hypothetical protein